MFAGLPRTQFLKAMRAEGIDVGIISKQLGHGNIATTARYLDHISPATVVEAMRRREWANGVTKL